MGSSEPQFEQKLAASSGTSEPQPGQKLAASSGSSEPQFGQSRPSSVRCSVNAVSLPLVPTYPRAPGYHKATARGLNIPLRMQDYSVASTWRAATARRNLVPSSGVSLPRPRPPRASRALLVGRLRWGIVLGLVWLGYALWCRSGIAVEQPTTHGGGVPRTPSTASFRVLGRRSWLRFFSQRLEDMLPEALL